MPTNYVMKATHINSPPLGTVYWVVTDSPDLTGAFSGYDPADLTGIAVDYTTTTAPSASTGVWSTVAGGDLSGSYPNPSVDKIIGRSLNNTTPTDGYTLTWSNADSYWAPKTVMPEYMDLDSDCVLCWRFQEASAPFPNLGTQTSEDMAAESGEGTVWAGGQPDGAFGKGLKFSMSGTGSGGIRASNFTFPTSVITASIWFTPTRTLGAASIGRAFFKAYYPSSWSAPYIGIEMGYFSGTGGFSVTANATGAAYVATANNDYNGVQLYKRHHLGMTFGDGNVKLYLNGYLIKTTVGANALDLGTGPWCIGRTVSSSSNEHCGMILHEARVDKVIRDADWFLTAWKKGKNTG